jgi:hypothetical protein
MNSIWYDTHFTNETYGIWDLNGGKPVIILRCPVTGTDIFEKHTASIFRKPQYDIKCDIWDRLRPCSTTYVVFGYELIGAQKTHKALENFSVTP